MSEWFSIESAPKDGTWILIPYEYYTDGTRFAAVHWEPKFELDDIPSPDETTWTYKGAWTDGICIDDETGRVRSFNPTQWTDIPPLPGKGL